MKTKIAFLACFLTITAVSAQPQFLTPHEKAKQATLDLQKRLGLKEIQLVKLYTLNLDMIQKARTLKSQLQNPQKLNRNYKEINEDYSYKLRGVLTPEQYFRWMALKNEIQNRRLICEKNNNSRQQPSYAMADPEAELEDLVTK